MYFPVDPATQRANCTTGSVRLADPQETSTTIEGRVEVCINQAWGTVCAVRFDAEDAGTVCQIAGGYLRSGTCACVIVVMLLLFLFRTLFVETSSQLTWSPFKLSNAA